MGIRQLEIDENNPYFNTEGMKYRKFASKFQMIRNYATIIAFDAPEKLKLKNLLEQQLSEIIKNAIIHGNKSDPNKFIEIWWEFNVDKNMARLIVQDQGEGFKDLQKWNAFHLKRMHCFLENNFDEMLKYISYKTDDSSDLDGGNALFAAVEFWNGGMIYNKKKNKVACVKFYLPDELK